MILLTSASWVTRFTGMYHCFQKIISTYYMCTTIKFYRHSYWFLSINLLMFRKFFLINAYTNFLLSMLNFPTCLICVVPKVKCKAELIIKCPPNLSIQYVEQATFHALNFIATFYVKLSNTPRQLLNGLFFTTETVCLVSIYLIILRKWMFSEIHVHVYFIYMFIIFLSFFRWFWGLNTGPQNCQAGDLECYISNRKNTESFKGLITLT
jgi:hypothetical protein